MSSPPLSRIRTIFDAVCDLDPEERDARLRELCGDDRDLLREVQELLGCTSEELPEPPAPHALIDAMAGDLEGAAHPGPTPRIDGFHVRRHLGSGGMGTVWLAEQISPRREVALKLLGSWSGDARSLHREAAALARLRHENVAAVFAAGVEEGVGPWIAIEYVEGAELTAWADEAQLGLRDRMRLLMRVGRGLEHAHQKGVIHCDLKPSNVLVDHRGEPRILDFGLARLLDDEASVHSLTLSGQIRGTLAYMSPEQCRPEGGGVDTRSDVHALGVLAYELIGGRRPHSFDGLSLTAALHKIAETTPLDLRAVAPTTPRDLATIVGKAMSRRPEDRYATASAFIADLERWLEGRPVQARPLGGIGRTTRWVRRHPLRAAVALVIMVLLGTSMWGVAQLPRLERQRAAETRETVEELVARGFGELEGLHEPEVPLASFEAALALDPDDGAALAGRLMVRIQQADHDPDRVQEMLAQLAPRLEARPELQWMQVIALEQIGFAEKARRLEDSLPRDSTPLSCFLRAMREMNRGHRGDTEAFARAADALQRATLLSERPSLMFATELAHAAYHTRDQVLARRVAHGLAVRWPEHPLSWQARALALLHCDAPQALQLLERVTAARPQWSAAWIHRQRTLARLGRRAEAVQVIRKSLLHVPDDRILRLDLARALLGRQDSRAEGLLELQRVAERHPNDFYTLTNLASETARDPARLSESVELWRRATRAKPDHPAGHDGLGQTLVQLEGPEAGLPHHREAVRLGPERENYRTNLATTLARLGRLEEALPHFETAVRLDPESLRARANLGRALMHFERWGEALTQFQKACQLTGDDRAFAKAIHDCEQQLRN